MVMRKSRYVTLLLAGAAATTLAACDQKDMTQDGGALYGDIAACSQERDAAECEQGFAQAKEEHAKQAPKFATQEECEAAGFTRCEVGEVKTASGGSQSVFMPMMMGYLMGQMMGGRGYGVSAPPPGAPRGDQPQTSSGRGGIAAGNAPGASRPVYGDRNGYLYTGGTAVARVPPGTTSLGSTPVRMTSRGGFGSSARGFSGGS